MVAERFSYPISDEVFAKEKLIVIQALECGILCFRYSSGCIVYWSDTTIPRFDMLGNVFLRMKFGQNTTAPACAGAVVIAIELCC